jgi:ArsR family metal-binding transcriptional regulator
MEGGAIMKLNVVDILKQLPRTNCKECGEATCMAFAAKLAKMEKKVEECKPLLNEEHAQKRKALEGMLNAA